MKYVIALINGLQYRLNQGDEIEVSRLKDNENQTVDLDKILLAVDDDKVTIGTPYIKEAKLSAKILKQMLGDKITVSKFKAKTGYRRRTGFRPKKTLLKIEKL